MHRHTRLWLAMAVLIGVAPVRILAADTDKARQDADKVMQKLPTAKLDADKKKADEARARKKKTKERQK